MSYVPIMSPSDRTQVSPRARELATQIEKVVLDFQRSYPDTRPGDVQQALRVAASGSDSTPDSRRVMGMTDAGRGADGLRASACLCGGRAGRR